MKRSWIQRKPPKRQASDDLKYLKWIRLQPCVVCGQTYLRNEAAHVGPRGLGQKCPDRQAVPLCVLHHTRGPEAHHVLGRRFWRFHGLSRDVVIARLNAAYDLELPGGGTQPRPLPQRVAS